MKKSPSYALPVVSIVISFWVLAAQEMRGTSTGCGTAFFILLSLGLAITAIVRTSNSQVEDGVDTKPLWDAISKLRDEITALRKQLRAQETTQDSPLMKKERDPGVAVPPPFKSVIVQPARPAPEFRSPRPVIQSTPEQLKASEPEPVVVPDIITSELTLDVAPPAPELEAAPLAAPAPEVPEIPLDLPPLFEPAAFAMEQSQPVPEPLLPAVQQLEASLAIEPAPFVELGGAVVPEAVVPEAAPEAKPDRLPLPGILAAPSSEPPPAPLPARPAFKPMFQQPPPPVVVEKQRWNMEDFLGTQLFLKAGVAILVIGVVFAMGLVFQRMGHVGKLAMSYLGALAMLGGGLYAERKPKYMTFGRAIIAGAWGILYFVTYAGGFIEASKVFQSETGAIAALLIAAASAVAF